MDQKEQQNVPTLSASVSEKTYLKSHSGRDAATEPVKHHNAIIHVAQKYDIAIFHLFYVYGLMAIMVTEPDLILMKVCQNSLGLGEEICKNLSSNDSSEYDEVYQESNTYMMYKTLIATGPAIVMILFLGPWSDKYGYKGPIIWANAGVLLQSIALLLNSIYFQLPVVYVVLSSIPIGITGGDITSASLTSAYVGNKTKEENRVVMLLLIELACSIASLVATFSAGFIIDNEGYDMLFISAICTVGVAVLWNIVIIKEQPLHQADLCTKAKDFISLQELKESCSTCMKKRSSWLRAEIWGLCLSNILTNAATVGDMQVTYYFTKKMYSWDLTKFTQVKTVTNVATTIVLPLTMAVVKRWKIDDLPLGIFVATCVIARYAILSFAYTEWLYYLSCAFGGFTAPLLVVFNSILMKCVEENEYGKLFAMKAGLLAAVPLVASPVATAIYNETISDFTGAVFLYCACAQAVPLVVFTLMLQTRARKTYSIKPAT